MAALQPAERWTLARSELLACSKFNNKELFWQRSRSTDLERRVSYFEFDLRCEFARFGAHLFALLRLSGQYA